MWRFILVSASPRRRDLLKRIIPVFDILTPNSAEEDIICNDPVETVKTVALKKLNSVEKDKDSFYIAADTIVEMDGKILGKPLTIDRAMAVLKELSGRWHRVLTGVAVSRGDKTLCHVETTEVKFASLTSKEIECYVETHLPLDKAGAYGIQDMAEVFIEEIRGSYSNVVGLPLRATYRLLRELGYRCTKWVKLGDVASVVRSKNAGPFEVTFDVMFDKKEDYMRFKEGNFITPEVFCKLYGISTDELLVFEYFDQALALKITIKRRIPSGSIGDEDIYAAQQHMPLFNLMIPWKVYG